MAHATESLNHDHATLIPLLWYAERMTSIHSEESVSLPGREEEFRLSLCTLVRYDGGKSGFEDHDHYYVASSLTQLAEELGEVRASYRREMGRPIARVPDNFARLGSVGIDIDGRIDTWRVRPLTADEYKIVVQKLG